MNTYLSTSLDAGRWRRESGTPQVLRSVLEAVMPLRNPDFEARYDDVCTWLLELENETGVVLREVGLDAQSQPIVVAPFGRNEGYWTNSTEPLAWHAMVRVDRTVFEAAWQRFQSSSARR